VISRGDLWTGDFGRPRGSAPAHRRPVVVVQADTYNTSSIRTVVVVAVTSNTRLSVLPGNVFLPSASTGLDQDSVANVTQVATLDRDDLLRRIGSVPYHLLDEIDRGLRRVLAL